MKKTCLAAAILLAATLPSTSRAESAATCTDFIDALPAVLTAKGVYCMDKDLGTSITTGNAITINTNGITVDCNGYRLSGLGAGIGTSAAGIGAETKSNLTVRNCGFRGFAKGIDASGDGVLVEDNQFEQNTMMGIEVYGDGGIVRRNRVFDTGGSTLQPSFVAGIYTYWHIDVVDNSVEGVFGSEGANTPVFGIRHAVGTGVRIARNVVRALTPTGTANSYAIYTGNDQKAFIDGNRVAITDPVNTAYGYRCNASNGSLRDNSEWGFTVHTSGCLDDGGNVDR